MFGENIQGQSWVEEYKTTKGQRSQKRINFLDSLFLKTSLINSVKDTMLLRVYLFQQYVGARKLEKADSLNIILKNEDKSFENQCEILSSYYGGLGNYYFLIDSMKLAKGVYYKGIACLDTTKSDEIQKYLSFRLNIHRIENEQNDSERALEGLLEVKNLVQTHGSVRHKMILKEGLKN